MTFRRVGSLCALLLVSATFLAGCSNSPMEPQARANTVSTSIAKPQFDATDSKYCAAGD